MNKLIGSIFLAMMLFAIAASVFASECGVTAFERSRTADDGTYYVGAWFGTQISCGDKGYWFISQETADVAPIGHAFDINMTGVGLGNRYHLTDNIKLYGQFGYYLVKNTVGGRNDAPNEALYYWMSNRWPGTFGVTSTPFDAYSVQTDNNFGGEIGLELNYPISKNWSTDMVFSYRILQIHQVIAGYRKIWDVPTCPECRWEEGGTWNYSTINLGLKINYKF